MQDVLNDRVSDSYTTACIYEQLFICVRKRGADDEDDANHLMHVHATATHDSTRRRPRRARRGRAGIAKKSLTRLSTRSRRERALRDAEHSRSCPLNLNFSRRTLDSSFLHAKRLQPKLLHAELISMLIDMVIRCALTHGVRPRPHVGGLWER